MHMSRVKFWGHNGDARRSSHLRATAALARFISDTVFRVDFGLRLLMGTLRDIESADLRAWPDGARVDQRRTTSPVCVVCVGRKWCL